MKITQISVLVLIASVIFSMHISTANADSGTCSDHGGVDCSSMADWDGSAVCNDGWRDSSELYSSAQECNQLHHSCKASEYDAINSKYNLAGKQQTMSDLGDQLQSLNNQATTLQIEAINLPIEERKTEAGGNIEVAMHGRSVLATALADNQIKQSTLAAESLTVENQFRAAQSIYWSAWNLSTEECWGLGDKEYQQQQANHTQSSPSLEQIQSLPLVSPTPTSGVCGSPNSHRINQNQCVCDAGYVDSGGQLEVCLPISDYCTATLGDHGIPIGSSCGCQAGYKINVQNNSCVAVSPSLTSKLEKMSEMINSQQQPTVLIDKGQDGISQDAVATTGLATSASSQLKKDANTSVDANHTFVKRFLYWLRSWFW